MSSDEKPWQLSIGLAFGGIIGLTPIWTQHNIFIMMGKEETKIRTDPTTRATDLLKTNFWTIASRKLT